MEWYSSADSKNSGSWKYGWKEIDGKKVGMLVTFEAAEIVKVDSEEAVKKIRAGLDHLAALGCDYAMIPGPAMNPCLIKYHMMAEPNCRAFKGPDEVADKEKLIDDMSALIKEDTPLVCAVESKYAVTEQIWLLFPLKEAPPCPFSFLTWDKDGNGTVVADKPESGEWVTTTEFKPGDEKSIKITVRDGGREIQAVRQAAK
jgi:hypothetical protein